MHEFVSVPASTELRKLKLLKFEKRREIPGNVSTHYRVSPVQSTMSD